jgi:hypothetical protein
MVAIDVVFPSPFVYTLPTMRAVGVASSRSLWGQQLSLIAGRVFMLKMVLSFDCTQYDFDWQMQRFQWLLLFQGETLFPLFPFGFALFQGKTLYEGYVNNNFRLIIMKVCLGLGGYFWLSKICLVKMNFVSFLLFLLDSLYFFKARKLHGNAKAVFQIGAFLGSLFDSFFNIFIGLQLQSNSSYRLLYRQWLIFLLCFIFYDVLNKTMKTYFVKTVHF